MNLQLCAQKEGAVVPGGEGMGRWGAGWVLIFSVDSLDPSLHRLSQPCSEFLTPRSPPPLGMELCFPGLPTKTRVSSLSALNSYPCPSALQHPKLLGHRLKALLNWSLSWHEIIYPDMVLINANIRYLVTQNIKVSHPYAGHLKMFLVEMFQYHPQCIGIFPFRSN